MNTNDPPKPPTPFRKRSSLPPLQRLLLAARGMKMEREAASNAVPRLLRSLDWSELSEHPDLRTWGALEYLGKLINDSLSKDPKYALAVAELAVAVAISLPDHAYPPVGMAQMRAAAWKDLGRSLRVLSRYDEALSAFVAAEAEVTDFGALGHDLAIIRFNMVVALQEMNRYDESLALIPECKDLFRNYGDTDGFVLCGIAEGVLLQRLRKYREAREIYLVLLSSTNNIETQNLAALHQAIGFCSIELGDFPTAEANLETALRLNRQLGSPVEIMKIDLGRGRLLARRGKYQRAIDHLRPVRRQFLSSGMPEEAGLCGLEVVEAMLALGKTSQAESLARRIVTEFTEAGLSSRAITALGYLTEAIASREVPVNLVGQVREYIASLRTAPERDFVYVSVQS